MPQNKIILVIGPKGSGKTRLVSELIEDIDRVAVFDMVKDSQYFQTGSKDRENVTVIEGRPRDFATAIAPNKETFKVVYHPSIIKMEDNGLIDSPEFTMLVDVCHQRGNMYLVVDEAHLFCNSYNCPKELMMASLVGRHKEFSMILVAQSFTGVHPSIRRNTDELYFWKIIEPSELDAIKDRCGKQVMEQVEELRAVEVDEHDQFKAPGQMLHWSKFKGIVEVTE